MGVGYPSVAELKALDAELLRYFRTRVPPHIDPRDLVAEVWVAMADFRGESSHRTYAFEVARRRLADFYRYRRDIEPLPSSDGAKDLQPGPSSMFEMLRERSALEGAIARLRKPFQDVARLYLKGADNFEIAEELNLHYNTARSRLSRALSKIAADLCKRHRLGRRGSGTVADSSVASLR